jgi:hypothetical protein
MCKRRFSILSAVFAKMRYKVCTEPKVHAGKFSMKLINVNLRSYTLWSRTFTFKISISCRIFRLFRFVSKQICLFRLFRYGSETPKRTEINRKNNLLVSRNKPKMTRNRLSFGLFRFEPKKN